MISFKFQRATGVALMTLAAFGRFSFATAAEPKLMFTLAADAGIRCLAVSPDGKTLASDGDKNTIRFWDLMSGKKRRP